MEQLIILGIVVVFSVLEALARKGRAAQGGGEGTPSPGEPAPPRPAPRARPVPHPAPRSGAPAAPRPAHSGGSLGTTLPRSYDEDPSFDDSVVSDAEPSRGSSEGLIPAEVWEEIQGLARGERPEPRERRDPTPRSPEPDAARIPGERPRTSSRSVPSRARPAGKAPSSGRAGAPSAQARTGKGMGRAPSARLDAAPAMEGTADHPVHLAHEAFGTAPSHRRAVAPEDGSRCAPAAAQVLLKLLAAGPGPLRQAVLLQEILGPPAALRDG